MKQLGYLNENVSCETFLNLIRVWNKKINLVAGDDDLVKRHLNDSAQLQKYIDSESRVVDLGSGAGFPGVVLSILGYKVTLVESDGRKCSFLREVRRKAHLDFDLFEGRIENLDSTFDVVTSRALSSLERLIGYSSRLLNENGYCVFLKGDKLSIELKEAEAKWRFNYEVYDSETNRSGKIIKISGITGR